MWRFFVPLCYGVGVGKIGRSTEGARERNEMESGVLFQISLMDPPIFSVLSLVLSFAGLDDWCGIWWLRQGVW